MKAEEYLESIGIDKGYLSVKSNITDISKWMEQYAKQKADERLKEFVGYLDKEYNLHNFRYREYAPVIIKDVFDQFNNQ